MAYDWAIIIAYCAIISFVFYWAQKIHYKPLKDLEARLHKKIQVDITSKIKDFKRIVKNVGEIEAAKQLLAIAKIKEQHTNTKEYFEYGFPLCAGLSLFFALFTILSSDEYKSAFVLFSLCPLLGLFIVWYSIYKTKNLVERYLNGSKPEQLLESELSGI